MPENSESLAPDAAISPHGEAQDPSGGEAGAPVDPDRQAEPSARQGDAAEPDGRTAQLEELRDVALRARADLDNAQKRHRRELENAHRYGAEKLISLLLPVIDSLERALSVDDGGEAETLVQQLLEGNRLTLSLFEKAFAEAGVVALDPRGEPFNPDLHQAITTQPTDTVAPNQVLEVMQKGYRLHDRLIRPAMVVVAQAPRKSPEPD